MPDNETSTVPRPVERKPPQRVRPGPWDRDTDAQDYNEFDYVLGRLQNIQQTAEGSNLPPIVRSGIRVIPPSGFSVVSRQDYEGATVVTLSWLTVPEMQPYNPSYRIRVLGVQGDLYATVTASPATLSIPVQSLASTTITFKLETRLSNGLVSLDDTCPTVAIQISPIWNYTRAITGPYAAGITDRIIYADVSVANYQLTLPDIKTLPVGWIMYIFVTNGALTLTVAGFNAVQTIDGGASVAMTIANPCKMLLCDGSIWRSFIPM